MINNEKILQYGLGHQPVYHQDGGGKIKSPKYER